MMTGPSTTESIKLDDATTQQEKGKNGNQDEESDDEVKLMLFEGSTHRLLFLDNIGDYKVTIWDKCLALLVITIQVFIYSVLAYLAQKEYDEKNGNHNVPLVVHHRNCIATNWTLTDFVKNSEQISDFDDLMDALQCDNPSEGVDSYLPIIAGSLVLVCALMRDFFESLALFKCRDCKAKVAAVLIFLEGAVAIGVGTFTGGITSDMQVYGSLESFLFIAGIVFVHDIDEQFGHWKSIQQRLGQTKYKYFEAQFWGVCALIVAGMFGGFYRIFNLKYDG